MTGKTLKELNVKPGDVVKGTYVTYTIAGQDADGDWFPTCRECDETLINDPVWTIVSRAPVPTPTRAELIAQRDTKAAEVAALNAQIEAIPETVRVWGGLYAGKWLFSDASFIHDTHYRDFPLIDGVPEGFVKVGEA